MPTAPERNDSLFFKFDYGHINKVNLESDSDGESDGTLLDDDFEEQFVRPTPDINLRPPCLIPTPQEDTTELQSFSADNRTLRPGKTVELRDGDFLRILAITQDRFTTEIKLKGFRFRRNNGLGGILEFKRNEVAMLLRYNQNDPRDIDAQSVDTVTLNDIMKVRNLLKTNRPFPSLSFRELDPSIKAHGKDYITAHGRLVCRWKYLLVNQNEGYVQALRVDEADDGVDDAQLRCDFRAKTENGGSCPKWLPGEKEFEQQARMKSMDLNPLHFHRRVPSLRTDPMDAAADSPIDLTVSALHRVIISVRVIWHFGLFALLTPLVPLPAPVLSRPMLTHTTQVDDRTLDKNRRYTFGDGFCGAGGASMGAKAAGLRIDWGFDFDPAAIDSHRRNFHHTRCECVAAHEFVTAITEDFKVDILHVSPPCQPWSPIHVWEGKNDDLNEATFLAVGDIVKKVKPRIVTLEETFGLTRTVESMAWFRQMIQMFTKMGFSVRWKVFNLADFGLPQPRKRLFIFASWYAGPCLVIGAGRVLTSF